MPENIQIHYYRPQWRNIEVVSITKGYVTSVIAKEYVENIT